MEVLVVGAGPVGLTAALALRAHGIACRIVEKRDKPSVLSRAVGIMPETVRALDRLGAGDAIRAEGMMINRMTIKRGASVLMALDVSKGGLGSDVMIALPQNRTEEILRDALQERGVHPEYGVAVRDISTTDDIAKVKFADGSAEDFDWVIAADGVHSTVRQCLGIDYLGVDLPEEWSIADVDVAKPFDAEQAVIYVQGDGNVFGMVLPIEPNRARVVSSTDDALAALPEPLEIETVRRTASFDISIRQAETYKMGRVLLAGDAAHCHSPVGGKGMNLGIADAVAAANAITEGETDHYTQKRHAAGARVMAASESGRKTIVSNKFFIKAATTVATFLAGRIPFIGRMFMRNLTRL
jgi:2-polyprenyl-6-methoxyphenol hydroxylase-like FAD-dependent oxidoreductase